MLLHGTPPSGFASDVRSLIGPAVAHTPWDLHAGLTAAGLEAVLLETRHVKAALSAMVVKTDLCGRPTVVKQIIHYA